MATAEEVYRAYAERERVAPTDRDFVLSLLLASRDEALELAAHALEEYRGVDPAGFVRKLKGEQ